MPLSVVDVWFDTPKTSSSQPVYVHGTLVPYSGQPYFQVEVNVTTGAGRNDFYYRTIDLTPNTTGSSVPVHGTYNLAIVPKYTGSNSHILTAFALSYKSQS